MKIVPDYRPEEGAIERFTLDGGKATVVRAITSGAGVVWMVSGVRLSEGSTPALPLRLDWEVFASDPCVTDDDPIAEGSTWCAPGEIRQGLLFQIAGRCAEVWFLRVTSPAGDYQVFGEVSWRSIPAECAGELSVLAGPVIG